MAQRSRGRILIDLTVALARVLDTLDELEIDYIVVGSTAAAAWGVIRMTRDVDLVAIIEPGKASLFLERLAVTDLYFPEGQATEASLHGGTFNVLHPESGGKVDVFVARLDDSFTRSRIDRRVRSEVLGLPAWVATPEDVVLAKLRWRLDSRSETQWRDCVEIAAIQTLDEDYLWSWATELGIADDLEELLGDVS